MPAPIDYLLERLKSLQAELEAVIDERRKALKYQVVRRRVVFETGVRAQHRAARVKLRDFLARTRLMVVLTTPIIYSLIIPFVLLDLFVTIYQAVCFPVYGIAKVRRRDHIVIDRHMLDYLNGIQKLNCLYCGYCNGILSYAREIAGRTEKYWCPIKHARRIEDAHAHYHGFFDYGDAEAFQAELDSLREQLRQMENKTT